MDKLSGKYKLKWRSYQQQHVARKVARNSLQGEGEENLSTSFFLRELLT